MYTKRFNVNNQLSTYLYSLVLLNFQKLPTTDRNSSIFHVGKIFIYSTWIQTIDNINQIGNIQIMMTNWLNAKCETSCQSNLFMSLMTLSAQFYRFISFSECSDAFYLKYTHHSRHHSKWLVIINLLIFSRLFWLAMDHDIPKISIVTRSFIKNDVATTKRKMFSRNRHCSDSGVSSLFVWITSILIMESKQNWRSNARTQNPRPFNETNRWKEHNEYTSKSTEKNTLNGWRQIN